MIYSAADLGIEIDFGTDQPGAILQRKEKGYWRDYLVDGEPVVNPLDVEALPAGSIGWLNNRFQGADMPPMN